ncbi:MULTISPECIES: hypothetical protein [Bacillaceae]|uniref:YhfM-like domain-containing protein n=1 Tax=Evansella alkalicola TaxID=745819 RepID=A0ABS6JS26_9BACI|nr:MULTISPECIES: hypothetical protein [Bacillaceae]MBU9720871.1 hypothetical protein [Bacillus alkalicola]
MKRTWILLICCFVILFGTGCTSMWDSTMYKDKYVSHIILEDVKNGGEYSKTFRDHKRMNVFIDAIENGEELPGILSYSTEFWLSINFDDGSVEQFDFSLGTDDDIEGLLVNLINTHKGFAITIEDSNALREIIY